VEQVALEIQRVLVGADEVRDQVLMGGAVIQDFDVFRGLDEDFGPRTGRPSGEKEKESRAPARDSLLLDQLDRPSTSLFFMSG
jgi:hypothetical protein